MDMLWKQAAIERLKLYEPKRLSLKSIPQEIRRLELEMQSIRSATSDDPLPRAAAVEGRICTCPTSSAEKSWSVLWSRPESGSL